MNPPVVRFLTKIIHPNVSRHGDVGIDIIQHNWSLVLTISKLLLSVQSLLTDPFTEVKFNRHFGIDICICRSFLFIARAQFIYFIDRFAWNQFWDNFMIKIDQDLRH